MQQTIRKSVSWLLTLAMIFSMLPGFTFTVLAAEHLCAHHTEHTADCGYEAGVSDCTYHCDICLGHDHGEPAPAAVCTCETDDPDWHAPFCDAYVAPEDPQCYCVEVCGDFVNDYCDVCYFDAAACAASGEEEAALFAGELCRMYQNYCAAHRLRVEEIEVSATELGGIKEAIYGVTGTGAYKLLKYESGVHRVQRVPATETQGRIHTSAATVAVLPEAEEVEVEINDKDIRIDIFHSGGAGGQNVNKVASAVRITHFPTGIVVTCQDERSQLKNKERAFNVLRSRVYDFYNGQNAKAREENRRSMVGTGDRSERIRTYNFPQSRVTDHRIGLSQYNLDAFMTGDIDSMVEALAIADREAMLASQEE